VAFANESPSGWQVATFSTSVAIQANTTYIISYYVADGNRRFSDTFDYFATAGTNTPPLHALQSGVDGPNGVYSDTGGVPNQSYRSSNYWVDAIFDNSADTTPPTVNAVVPANGSTGVPISANVNVTFSEAMNASTINTSAITLRNASNQVIPATVNYNSATLTATLTPTSSLSPSVTYTVQLPAGGAMDLAGNAIAQYTSTFTTAATAPVSYSIWPGTVTPGFAYDNPSPIELGVKFRSDVSGNVTGVRFFKAAGATGTHIGRLWTTGGVKLAEVAFANESPSGWQVATFSTSVAIQANTTYIISYYVADGNRRFSDTIDYFATAGTNTPPLHALQSGVDGANGVYSETGGVPNQSYRSSNYWVDIILSNAAVSDTTPPSLQSVKPINGSSNLRLATNATIYFSEPMNPATISSTTIQLRDTLGNLVPATVTYGSSDYSAVLDPISNLNNSKAYTVTVKGNISGVRDIAGNALNSDLSWSFSTLGQRPPVDQAPGGPILIISKSSNLYTRYYIEILRTEGFNEFNVTDISQVTPQSLASYDIVILGEMPLSSTQVTTLTAWVQGGGKLIAMRPDKQLTGLLGLSDTASTLSEGYLSIDVSANPGAGITGQTLQFHGIADQYSLVNGAVKLATLYSHATTATPYPAVTLHSIGSNGGQAAAFTFDLARSIIYTHQGNPAWQIGHVNPLYGTGVALDLFYDSTNPWVDFNRISIPQADEQQRFLANLILYMNSSKKPLPRFWYLPKGKKAVVVLTGDDHNTRQLQSGSTSQFFARHEAQSPIGCSVADWECVRSSSYLSPEDVNSFTLTDAEVASYTDQGFEVGLHADAALALGSGHWCDIWPSDLAVQYADQLDRFMLYYASIPVQASERTHCVSWFGYTGGSSWLGYAGKPEVEASLEVRLDTDIYYGPLGWATINPGYQMGSAMMMRFAQVDTSGIMTSFLDSYNAGTQITDDNGQGVSAIRTIVDSFLDAANGPLGFYGGFVVNMHSDNYYGWSYDGSDQVVASAQARGVPIVSGQQMVNWLDGRNSSSFSSITWDGKSLGFTIAVDPRARNLRAMLPTKFGNAVLNGIIQNGTSVSYTIQTIKGIEYAFFSATSGSYTATY